MLINLFPAPDFASEKPHGGGVKLYNTKNYKSTNRGLSL